MFLEYYDYVMVISVMYSKCILGKNSMQICINSKICVFIFKLYNHISKLGCFMFDNIRNHSQSSYEIKNELEYRITARDLHIKSEVWKGAWHDLDSQIFPNIRTSLAMNWNLIKQSVGWSMSYDQMKTAWGNKLGKFPWQNSPITNSRSL